ncbi:hypothetical protein MJT46_015348 [Ovis ammon polii x Ovis aries]|nr:hypothetical protein MJT46_015348 [Ovis ammon polii x Ovis aries]
MDSLHRRLLRAQERAPPAAGRAGLPFYQDCSESSAPHITKQSLQELQGFPGGSGAKNLPSMARDRFGPWSRNTPYAVEQLSPCPTTVEPVLETVLHNKSSHRDEKPAYGNSRAAPAPCNWRKNPGSNSQRPSTAKNKETNK